MIDTPTPRSARTLYPHHQSRISLDSIRVIELLLSFCVFCFWLLCPSRSSHVASFKEEGEINKNSILDPPVSEAELGEYVKGEEGQGGERGQSHRVYDSGCSDQQEWILSQFAHDGTPVDGL